MTVAKLRERFEEELDAIDAYVNLLQDRAFVSAQDVNRLIRTLEEYNISDDKPDVKLVPGSYTIEELQSVHDFIRAVQPNLDAAFREAENELISIAKPDNLDAVDVRSLEGECIQYVLELLGNGEEVPDFYNIRLDLKEQIRSQAQIYSDEYDKNYQHPNEEALVEFAIRSAIYLNAAEKTYRLHEALESADEIDANLRIIRTEATVNVFRQAFILLMTIFDATIFDLMKLALTRNFFRLIGSITKQDRLPYERFGSHTSFDSLRNEIIEEKLKPKYLKDLLFIIRDQGVPLNIDPYNFGNLIELVLRRNIHVHNRGIVDERYLERNSGGDVMFNFDNFSLGDFADINQDYWTKAKAMCQGSVRIICNWVDDVEN